MNNTFFTDISLILSQLLKTSPNAKFIIVGDFNEVPDDLIDRFPTKVRPHSQCFNIIDSLYKDLSSIRGVTLILINLNIHGVMCRSP